MTEFCESVATRGHERFGCLEPVGHELPHRGTVVPPPCEGCGGLEEHDGSDCAFSDTTADDHACSFEVVWDDDGVVRTEPWEPALPFNMAVTHADERWEDSGETDPMVPASNGWPAVAVQDRLTAAWYLRAGPPTRPRQIRPENGVGGWYSEEEALAEAREMGFVVENDE